MNRIVLSLALGAVLTASSAASAQDQADRSFNRAMPANIQSLKLSAPAQMNAANFAGFICTDAPWLTLMHATNPAF